MFSVQQKARRFASSSQDTSQPRVVVDPGMRRSLSYGIAGNIRALLEVYRAVERYWRKMLCSRSWAGAHLTWDAFHQLKERTPLQRPKLQLPYRALQALAVQL